MARTAPAPSRNGAIQQVQTRPAAALQAQQPNAQGGTIEALLRSPKITEQIRLALPKHLDADRLLRIALTEIRRNPKLAECSQASLLGALFQAAQLGLEIGGQLGQAYLVPYGREVQFQPGYRGLMELARRSGEVTIEPPCAVYLGDKFECTLGLHRDLQHEPDWNNPNRNDSKNLTFVYAVAYIKGVERPIFEVMSRAQIENLRKRSKSPNGGAWSTDYEAMALAKVTKRLCKWLPVSVELARAVAADDAIDAGLQQETPIDHLLPQEEAPPLQLQQGDPEPEPVQEATVTVEAQAEPPAPIASISDEQLEKIIGAIEKRLGAVGAEAFVTEVCTVMQIDDLSQLPADAFSAVMKSLADDKAIAAWSEGKSRQGAQLISAERIQELLSDPSPELPLQPQAMPEFD